jgi:hypothetical protein
MKQSTVGVPVSPIPNIENLTLDIRNICHWKIPPLEVFLGNDWEHIHTVKGFW